MTGFGETPGITSATDTPSPQFILAGKPTVVSVVMVSTAVDTGNTGQTYILRAGLSVGKITTGSKYLQYLTGAVDGSGVFKGFLMENVNMKGPDGVARDTIARVAIGGQPLINEAAVIGLDSDAKADQVEKFLWSSDYGAA
jgi:hypothetical protein